MSAGAGTAGPWKSGVAHGARETGWLPDFVYTGDKFEAGLAFFADATGRITRFSREAAEVATARRLEGQVAMPGCVNAHAHTLARAWRGRGEATWPAGADARLARFTDDDIVATARLAFLELLLAGVTCVGEFHGWHQRADGTPWPEPDHVARLVARAAHDVGIRLALFNVAWLRGDVAGDASTVPAWARSGGVDAFLRTTETLRVALERDYPGDEVWLGVGGESLRAVPIEALKAIGQYARTQRLRFHLHLPETAESAARTVAEHGRGAVALLSENGLVDKRFTGIGGGGLTAEEIRLLGTARATVALTPLSSQALGQTGAPPAALLAAGAGLALGTDRQMQPDLLKEARAQEQQLRVASGSGQGLTGDPVTAWLHAATVGGARSLGATTGALEVGRPADFFTVNRYDPSLVGADAATLGAHLLFAMERRAIRDVWIGGRAIVVNGRHAQHGAIVARFAETQQRVWSEKTEA